MVTPGIDSANANSAGTQEEDEEEDDNNEGDNNNDYKDYVMDDFDDEDRNLYF